MNLNKNDFLFQEVSSLKGVGSKIKKYLEKKKIEKIKDFLWDLPYSIVDRSKISKLDKLEIGKIMTIKVVVSKYNFPRIRNLPNKVVCQENEKKIHIVFFNSPEGYIRKILPIGNEVIISGKINFYKKNYQITNPTYIKKSDNVSDITKIFPKYSLTEGLKEKTYRNLLSKVLKKLDEKSDWYEEKFLKKNKFNNFKNTFLNLHNPDKEIDINSNDYRRLAYDEILSNLLTLYKARKNIRIFKKKKKKFTNKFIDKIYKNFSYKLTNNQKSVIKEINEDISSDKRMFRLLQGDVGSGKTIVALIAAANVIESNHQVALMAPTEILATQHYENAKKIYSSLGISIEIITGSTSNQNKLIILEKLKKGEIDFLIGTHALFQKKINFLNLGFIIIDEQHKFGVKQRIKLAKKGGDNCDLLLMSATPIPRTMMMSLFGDMDISIIKEKPQYRKDIITLVKPENKTSEIWQLLNKQILDNQQIFWVCPLIEESNKLDFSSAEKKYKLIKNYFPDKVGLIHGKLNDHDKKIVLDRFLKKQIKILVSTTVIEVGIDFPNANVIIIENANKFGLSQLHQLRGRVGRGNKEAYCIMIYKNHLSQNARKRLQILRKTNDGFVIAEEDLKIRGHGDILGFQQSGIKNFRFADPIHHKDLFILAENNIKFINANNIKKYSNLLKFFDRTELITEI